MPDFNHRKPTSVKRYTQVSIDKILAKVYAYLMSTEQLEKAKRVAKRTLKIIELIQKGLSSQEIVSKTGANRQLVDYYVKMK